jgi:opacity protein-like surface antigen
MVEKARIGKTVFGVGGGVLAAMVMATGAQAAQCGATVGADTDDTQVVQSLTAGAGAALNSIISVTNTVNSAILGQGSSAFVSSPSSPSIDQQGGGVWTRGVAGTVNTFHNSNIAVSDVGGGAADIPETTHCYSRIRQSFAGIQVGADFARLNWAGSGTNLHLGLTSGYTESSATEINGSFRGNFQIPFIGLYGVLTSGNFFADAQVRSDFYQNQITDAPGVIFDQKFNATGVAVAGNVGYHLDLGNSWFIEPSLGAVWSRVAVDDVNFANSAVLQPSATLVFNGPWPGTGHVGTIDSVLGRASARIGTTINAGGIVYQPFLTGSVYHEFMGDVTSTIHLDANDLRPKPAAACSVPGETQECAFNVTQVTTRVRTFGQVGLGLTASLPNTGWLGFVRTDYRAGADINGVTFSGGLRYQYDPGKIVAPKGLITKAPIASAQPYNWTGAYVGGFVGGIEGNADWSYQSLPPFPNGTNTRTTLAGILAGGTLGYNMQMGPWVIGLESDIGWTAAGGGKSAPCPSGFLFTCEASMDWLATVTGRLGYAFNRLLVYGKGGLAVGEVTASSVFNPRTLNLGDGESPPSATVFSGHDTAVGWTIGGGFEFALAQNWSAKAELMYFDLGQKTYQLDAPVSIARNGAIGRVGVNYHF